MGGRSRTDPIGDRHWGQVRGPCGPPQASWPPEPHPVDGWVEIGGWALNMMWDFQSAVPGYALQPNGSYIPVFNTSPCTVTFTINRRTTVAVTANYAWGNDGVADCPVWQEIPCP